MKTGDLKDAIGGKTVDEIVAYSDSSERHEYRVTKLVLAFTDGTSLELSVGNLFHYDCLEEEYTLFPSLAFRIREPS